MMKESSLHGPVAGYFHTANGDDLDGFTKCFADNAVLTDVNREIRGLEAITEWARTEIFAAHVRFTLLNVRESEGQTVVTVEIDGTFDRTGLPDQLVMDHAIRVADGKITQLRTSLAS
jgi:ketosteroid isomerase-like protein